MHVVRGVSSYRLLVSLSIHSVEKQVAHRQRARYEHNFIQTLHSQSLRGLCGLRVSLHYECGSHKFVQNTQVSERRAWYLRSHTFGQRSSIKFAVRDGLCGLKYWVNISIKYTGTPLGQCVIRES